MPIATLKFKLPEENHALDDALLGEEAVSNLRAILELLRSETNLVCTHDLRAHIYENILGAKIKEKL